ncbi:MAG: glycoside hydrolase family 88 protein [Rhodospirillaceae bacterium]|nr:glycoside hydrolase family 88 protein [Rhodospirillaceae bacterium]
MCLVEFAACSRVALFALLPAACIACSGNGADNEFSNAEARGAETPGAQLPDTDTPATVTFEPPRVLPYVVDVDAPMASLPGTLRQDHVRAAGNLAADWQIRHMDAFAASTLVNFQGLRRYSIGGWLMGAMAVGMTRWGVTTDNPGYVDFIREQGANFGWGMEAREFDADDYVIGQTWLELFELDGDPAMIGPLTERLDYVYANWPTVNRDFGRDCELMNVACRERWTWIDALFMGAPVWIHLAAVTGDERYLEFAEHEFWASFETFWDADERLLYRDRRYMPMRDDTSHKVFWSRGNGWVFASFARILPKLPGEHPGRQRYLNRFLDMAARLIELQQAGGYWTSSLTNPSISPTPETSGSAFFTYGLAWGINEGLLDREIYLPAVERAWASLVSNLYADGRLAYVQPSGSAPQTVHKESTDVYGVGAFLLAASEVFRLSGD